MCSLHEMPSGSEEKEETTTQRRKQENINDRVPWNLSPPGTGVMISYSSFFTFLYTNKGL